MFEVSMLDDPSTDAVAAYARYRAAVPELIAAHGGRYLARAATGTALEGDQAGDRFHLLEFPDAEAARAFWSSPEYLALKPGRAGAVSVRAVLIEPS